VIDALGIGDLAVRDDDFTVAEGRVAPEVATVHATFADGSTAVDHPEGGIWLFVERGHRSPTVVEALDRAGNVLARRVLNG
jgi:hypothetical protein